MGTVSTAVTDNCFAEKRKSGETADTVMNDDVVTSSPQKSDNDELPQLSPPDGNAKPQATMPELLHPSTL